MRIEKAVRREVGALLSTVLHATREDISSWYDWRADDARAAVMTDGVVPAVRDLLDAHVGSKNLLAAPAQHVLRAKMRPFMINKGYLGYFVISPDGINLASSRDVNVGVRSLLNEDPNFLSAIFSGHNAISRPQISDVPLPDATGALMASPPTLFVGVPIFLPKSDHVIAAFAFRIDTVSDFSAIFANWRLGKSGETYAVGADGLLLSESRFDEDLRKIGLLPSGVPSMLHIHVRDPGGDIAQGYKPRQPRHLQPLTQIVQGIADDESKFRIKEYRDYRGVDVLGVRLWDSKFNFGIVAKINADEALKTLHTQQYMIWGVIFLAIGLMVVLAVFVHRSRTDSEALTMRTQAILDNAIDGILTIDLLGIVRSFNPAAERIFGYRASDVIGQKMSSLLAGEEKQVGGVDIDKYLSEKSDGAADAWQVIRGKRKSGAQFPMDIAITKIRVGEKYLYLGTVRDITERRHAEETLRQSEERLKNAQRIAHLGSWSWNFDQDEMIWSDEIFRIFGLRPKEIQPTFARFMKIVHPQDRTRVEGALRNSWDGKKGFHFEHRILLANGNQRTVQEIGEIVSDDVGNIVRMDATVHNITERKQAEMAKSEFVATVSHELRTPMTSIHGSLGLLLGGAAGTLGSKKKELVELAYNSSERLVRLINDILDFEKLEAGSMNFNMIEYPLNDLLDQAVDANASYAEKFQVKLERLPIFGDAFVLVDIDRFAQVMANLLSNAIKFSPPGASIEISAQVRGKNVRVSVTDHGPGIPEEFRGQIFQKFTQADSSDTRAKGGTGLGLSITRSMINNMHGVLSFETHLGRGTIFYFDLPLMLRSRMPPQEGETSHDTLRILICGDDHATAMHLKETVVAAGGRADIARTLKRASKLQQANAYVAMILDIASTGSDAIALLHRIHREKNGDECPVIAVSAVYSDNKENLLRGGIGVVEWLDEPIDFLKLKSTVKEVLDAGKSADVLYIETGEDNAHVHSQVIDSSVGLLRARNVLEARRIVARDNIGLVLLDVTPQNTTGIELLSGLERPDGATVPVLVLSAEGIEDDGAGRVVAILMKTETEEEFRLKIRGMINDVAT
ncbi:PAS domain S-box protein [Varunaivibrio sulfuroxidans]|nr:PAS domain S-box protein [Varunaivibrio sulfuroxidans]WES31513.1 PAS domain S-box protein [Varunaivibrio sulfuroxidans]